MLKDNLVKIAKTLIRNDNKQDLYDLFKLCKAANIDISKDINYDYKDKYKDSKVLMITLKAQEYSTKDKYVEDSFICYIEIDNLVSEGIESVATVQSKGLDKDLLGKKIISSLDSMKKEIIKEVIMDLADLGKPPESFLKDFKILYHYDKNSEEILSPFLKDIQREFSKKEFEQIKKEVSEEREELMAEIKGFAKEGNLK